jgi:SAM-dependent methyltransferase
MAVKHCRVCGNRFFPRPLLRYGNMPRAAQFLPDAKSVRRDSGADLTVCQCAGCGLVQLNNDPVPYYREVIRAAAFSARMKAFREKQFAAFVKERSLRRKKVIEIGCGRGEYLKLMKAQGVRAYGLEYSRAAVTACRDDGLDVFAGFLQSGRERLRAGPFDAFFILNFFEHLPDPNAVLAGITRNLVDGGVGLVEVPNFDMMLQKKLFSEFVADHLSYFTRATLIGTLAANGFEVLDCRAVWHEYILSAVVKRRTPSNLSAFGSQQKRVSTELANYVRRFGWKRVAVWGAGHQALALLALSGLSGKIKYVVDSAPFKQGRFTPATHVPIVSPDALETDPVRAIIVMAASYSDEVAEGIRSRFGGGISVAIVRDTGLEEVRRGKSA